MFSSRSCQLALSALAAITAHTSILVQDSWAQGPGRAWVERIAHSPNDAALPAPRFYHSLAYDESRNVTVLFGGQTGGSAGSSLAPNDTWEWDGTEWRLAQAASPMYYQTLTHPGARVWTAMAWDPMLEKVILFGGAGYDNNNSSARLGDTWVWDGTSWEQISYPGGPPARSAHGMALDRTSGSVILHSGHNVFGYSSSNDTWEWNGSQWTRRTGVADCDAVHGICALRNFAMASFTGVPGGVLINGGRYWHGTDTDRTYLRLGGSWTDVPAGPAPRRAHTMAGDVASGQVVLFGGVSPSGTLDDTWVFNRSDSVNDWVQVGMQVHPGRRYGHAMAYDIMRDEVVVLGGLASGVGPSNDTWVAVPCPADFDGDWEISNLDVNAFLDAWVRRKPEANCDQFPQIDHRDVLCFLTIWLNSCE